MRKIGARVLVVLALVACLGVSQRALAVGFEDSLDDCSYPKLLDLLILRELSFLTMIGGAVLFVPIAPWAAATAWRDFDDVADALIVSSARFTFKRPLGECAGVVAAY